MPQSFELAELVNFVQGHMTVTPHSQYTQVLLQASDPTMEMPARTEFDAMMRDVAKKMPAEDRYTSDGKFDCDDFAFILKGLVALWVMDHRADKLPWAFGVAWGTFSTFGSGRYHALNWVLLNDDRKLRWIEPQFVSKKPLDDAMTLFRPDKDRLALLVV